MKSLIYRLMTVVILIMSQNVKEDPIKFSQFELNDLIKDLCLSKEKSAILASRLKKRNLLKSNVKVTHFRKSNNNLIRFYKFNDSMVYYCDKNGLFETLGQSLEISEWILFIDSSKVSLRAVIIPLS